MTRRAPREPLTFIVRLSSDRRGRIVGIVERVKTGRKERCVGLTGIGDVIGRMLAERDDASRPQATQTRAR